MVPADVDPESGCRLPLPKRAELDADAQRVYDGLADPGGESLRGLRGVPAASCCTAPSWHALPARSTITCGMRRVWAAGFASWRS